MCRFLNNLFTVTGNNNAMYSTNRFGSRNFHSKIPIIVFQINSINLTESEEFRETWNRDVFSDICFSFFHVIVFFGLFIKVPNI